MLKIFKAFSALVVLAVLLVGLPWAVLALGGVPFSEGFPDLEGVKEALTLGMWDAPFIISGLQSVVLVGWAILVLAFLFEVVGQVKGIKIKAPGLGFVQKALGSLVGSVFAISTLGSGAAFAADDAPEVSVIQEIQIQDQVGPNETVSLDQSVDVIVHVVGPGESLWQIAQHYYGDGAKYGLIAEANYDRVQEDGARLEAGDHWLEVGWQLVIPQTQNENATVIPVATVASEQLHVVGPGESLWQIAQHYYGDGAKYGLIAEANGVLDASKIDVGQNLLIPAVAAASTSSVVATVSPALSESVPDDLPTQTVNSSNGVDGVNSSNGVDGANSSNGVDGVTVVSVVEDSLTQALDVAVWDSALEEADSQQSQFPLFAGGVLATGLIGLLSWRRLVASRNRRPGQRVSAPEAESSASVLEMELRASVDPLSVDSINLALRHLLVSCKENGLALPDVRAAFFKPGESFDIYLENPADLPAPWVMGVDNQEWSINADAASSLPIVDSPCPFPALVTVGRTEEGKHFMLNLEMIDTLGVNGPQSKGALAGLALELATTPWAQQLRLTLVGMLDGVEQVLDSRIRHVPSLDAVINELRLRADQVSEVLKSDQVLSSVRAFGELEDFEPEIIFVSGLTADQRRELEEIVSRIPRVGVAAVIEDGQHTSWSLDLAGDGSAVVMPIELDVQTQSLDDQMLTETLQLISGVQVVSGPSVVQDIKGEIAPDDARFNAITAPEILSDDPLVGVVFDDEIFKTVFDSTRPLISVLSPLPSVENWCGKRDEVHVRQLVEASVFILLNPGSSLGQVAKALWPTKDVAEATKKSLASRVRNMFGALPDGALFLPRLVPKSGDGYRFVGVQSDWEMFQSLIGPSVAQASSLDLVKALRLVGGRPFEMVPATKYAWADGVMREVTELVMDVVHEVSSRALGVGNVKLARQVAALGRRVDPVDERIWRDAIKAELVLGSPEQAKRLVLQLQERVLSLDLDLEDETLELVSVLDKAGV